MAASSATSSMGRGPCGGRRPPGLMALTVFIAVMVFQVGVEQVVHVLVAEDRLGMSAGGVGVLAAAVGVGGLLVAPFTARIGSVVRAVRAHARGVGRAHRRDLRPPRRALRADHGDGGARRPGRRRDRPGGPVHHAPPAQCRRVPRHRVRVARLDHCGDAACWFDRGADHGRRHQPRGARCGWRLDGRRLAPAGALAAQGGHRGGGRAAPARPDRRTVPLARHLRRRLPGGARAPRPLGDPRVAVRRCRRVQGG